MRTPRGFSTVVADPAWEFGDKLPGDSRGAEKNYTVMSVEGIRLLHLPPIADDALLFLWRVSSQVEEAYSVVRAWGFVPKSEMVWKKLTVNGNRHFGMGRYVRMEHESVIIATRGRGIDLIENRSIRSVFEAPVGEHSEKPAKFYEIVEELVSPRSRRVELFSRKQREGWTCIGDALGSHMTTAAVSRSMCQV